MSREGVILSQANKYIDPILYDGPELLLSLTGSALQNQTVGYATKLNDNDRHFGDLIDGETTVKDEANISQSHCAQIEHYLHMQQPYFVTKDDVGDCQVNAPGYRPPKQSHWKRDAEGKRVYWDDIKVPRPVYRCSPLRHVWSVDEEEERAVSFFADEVRSMDEQQSLQATFQSTAVEVSMAVTLKNDGGDSGYASEELEAAQSIKKSNTKGTDGVVPDPSPDVEEYSPFALSIPGLRAVHEDWQPEEMPEDEGRMYADELFLQTSYGATDPAQPFTHSYEDVDLTKTTSAERQPLPPLKYIGVAKASESISPVMATDQEDQASEMGHTSNDEEWQLSSPPTSPETSSPVTPKFCLLTSAIHTSINTPPSILPTKPAAANTTPSTIEDAHKSRSKYAGVYAACIIGLSVVLSLW
ncbi:MAG: hypothetical protein Q9166_006636 [cf. Caloplaca sp. 2 TL-2023]